MLIILKEWKVFKIPDFDVIKSRLKQHIIFDGRNLLSPRVLGNSIKYYCIEWNNYNFSRALNDTSAYIDN